MADDGIPTLMFTADVRDYCAGVTRHTLIAWREHHLFPSPVAERGPCAVFDAAEVRAWWLDWQTRKKPHATSCLMALQLRREERTMPELAQHFGVGQSTVRRWLRVAVGPYGTV